MAFFDRPHLVDTSPHHVGNSFAQHGRARLLCWDSQHKKALRNEVGVFALVSRPLAVLGVMRAIDLEHQTKLCTKEVYDEPTDDVLAPKFESETLSISKNFPRGHLSWRGSPAKKFGEAPALNLK